jgi:outer membrane protein assembly factor BamB
MPRLVILSCLCCALAAYEVGSTWGSDPHRNMMVLADRVPAYPETAQVVWEVEQHSKWQLPQPSIVDGRVLIGATGPSLEHEQLAKANRRGGAFICRDLASGELLWELAIPNTRYEHSYGVCSSPLVAGDRIYLLGMRDVLCLDLDGMADGNDGMTDEVAFMLQQPGEKKPILEAAEFSGLGDKQADIIWRYHLDEHWDISYQDATAASPLLIDGQLWISTSQQLGSQARQQPAGEAPHLVVLDADTGRAIARDELEVPIVFHGQWATPAAITVQGQTVVLFPDGYGRLHGLRAPVRESNDGNLAVIEELWCVDINPREYRYQDDGSLRIYTDDKRLYFKYPADYPFTPEEEKTGHRHVSKELKLYGPAEIIAAPVVVDDRILVHLGRDCFYTHKRSGMENVQLAPGRMVCLRLDDPTAEPELLWENRNVGRSQCTASVDVTKGRIYLADIHGLLHCLDLTSGDKLWHVDVEDNVSCRSQILIDDKIYVGNDKSQLLVFDVSGTQPQLLSTVKYKSAIATPTAMDGHLLLQDMKGIRLYRQESEVSMQE